MVCMSKAMSLFPIVVAFAAGGCVTRTLTVRSDPPGALVYMNDQEIGRTPVTRSFMWYGIYDVELRKDGFESIKTTAPVIAPWWQWIPVDFAAEFFNVTDHHELMYTLRPASEAQAEPDVLIQRGEDLRAELVSSRNPTTKPTTRPHHHKKGAETKPSGKKE